jgi:hypothetical protein
LNYLYHALAEKTDEWRQAGYPHEAYPAIAEILRHQMMEDGRTLRFLRKPQLRSLETYWYLRLVMGTPHVFDIYKEFHPRPRELRESLGLSQDAIRDYVEDNGTDALWDRIRTDDDFVKAFKIETLRETLTLAYPSYIFALAMGAGKTILIAAIIATEFAMALEYPDGLFVENALVFAPGKTIIESLREISDVPYNRILPARLHKQFAASVKLAFTRDGEKDIPVIRRSSFNVVVTNTEKIRIQKETVRKSDIGGRLSFGQEDEARTEVANLRLQAIASLPHLAVFSDEAHHTYGQSMDRELKKVRKTVDYLADKTNLIAVVNTTGTPYFQRQPLRDVVTWYGLSEGIKDGYLKDLSGNIQAFDFSGDAGVYAAHVVKDFFKDYGDVTLQNGAPAKLAMYFPQTDDLRELKPVIDRALVESGLSPAVALINTSDTGLTKQADVENFNRLNDPDSIYRVLLLVNKGTEGWNCPSLFACALVRQLRTSNNFVLQAATRCMRQVAGNTRKARVYLSTDNFGVLDRQLQETYGESISDLNNTGRESGRAKITLRKINLPLLTITREVRTVVRQEMEGKPLTLVRPADSTTAGLTRRTFSVQERRSGYGVLQQVGDTVTIEATPQATDAFALSVELAMVYRLPLREMREELLRLYGGEDIPLSHVEDLARQIEEQVSAYEIRSEKVDIAMALVKPEGFSKENDSQGNVIYTAEIVYPKDREYLLMPVEEMAQENLRDLGFHYTPYNFDSNPEKSFYEQMLHHLNMTPSEVEDILFTGAITDPGKTDFFVEYKDDKGRWRRYTPDFIIRRKDGKCLIAEVKAERERAHPLDGENGRKALAVRKWENLNPERLKYAMIFTAMEVVSWDQTSVARSFIDATDTVT